MTLTKKVSKLWTETRSMFRRGTTTATVMDGQSAYVDPYSPEEQWKMQVTVPVQRGLQATYNSLGRLELNEDADLVDAMIGGQHVSTKGVGYIPQ